MVYNRDMSKNKIEGMWDYLSGLDKYLADIPVYVEKPFSDEQVANLVSIIDGLLAVEPEWELVPGGQEEYRGKNWFDPKRVVHMAREMVEFEAPKDLELTMDSHIKHLYPEEIKLCHYSYIDYAPRHGEGKYAPSLPPHIDNTETILTFNYMLDGNIDWEIYVDNKPYSLKKGDALIFSAINQPHFRPKRKWKDDEFVKILTFDYSPLTDWRFTTQEYPLDPNKYQERIQEYLESVNQEPQMQQAWMLYNNLGLEQGIPTEKHGLLAEN
tara:strand:+ start:20697 stop:21503 length:807 start_codon:yes stop_codon:yes gene_type:complete